LAIIVMIGCGGGGRPAVVDGGGDVADAGEQAPDATATTCGVYTPAPADLCGGAPGCTQRRALQFQCSSNGGNFDFALAPDGRALVTLATRSPDRAAFLLEVWPNGEHKIWPLGPAFVADVAVGPDGEPQVLLWPGGTTDAQLGRWVGGAFVSQPISLTGAPWAFAVGPDGVPLVLTVGSAWNATLMRLSTAGATSEVVVRNATTTDGLSFVRLLVDARGAPTVVYAVSDQGQRVYRRWTAGVTTEIQRVSTREDDDTSVALMPDGKLRLARTDRGSLLLFGDGAPERTVFAAPSWTPPTCGGQTVAYYPDLCPKTTDTGTDVGEQIASRGAIAVSEAGALFSAAYTGHLRVGCAWTGGCIEMMTCQCMELPYARLESPLVFRVRPIDGTSGGWTLLTPGATLTPRYAVDHTGAHHLLWFRESSLTLATFDLRAP
jgi:hypothetical protein